MLMPFCDTDSFSSDRSIGSSARKTYVNKSASLSGMHSHEKDDELVHSRRDRPRVTLPPLSAITSVASRDIPVARSPRDLPLQGFARASTSNYALESTRPMERGWTGSSSSSHAMRYTTGYPEAPPSRATNLHQMSDSTSPITRRRTPILQASLDSSTHGPPSLLPSQLQNRPRSLSSPHRTPLEPLARRAQQTYGAEVDRLLENLIFIQDTNRRLGLPTGSPASPDVIQSSNAIDLLVDKVYSELEILARFSQSRAEMVCRDLGLAYTRHPRTPTGSIYDRVVSMSDQSGYQRDVIIDERTPLSGSMEAANSNLAAQSYPTAVRLPRAASDEFFGETNASYYDNLPGHDTLRHGANQYQTRAEYEHSHQRQSELLDRRSLSGKGMKRVRKRKNEHHQECLGCQAKETPEWRKGPMGPRTLCNACGLLYAKLNKRRRQESDATTKASGMQKGGARQRRDESPGARQASLEALRAELDIANGLRNRASSTSMMTSRNGGISEPTSAALDPPLVDPRTRLQTGQSLYQSYYAPRETANPSTLHNHPGVREGHYSGYRSEGHPYHDRTSRGRAYTIGQVDQRSIYR